MGRGEREKSPFECLQLGQWQGLMRRTLFPCGRSRDALSEETSHVTLAQTNFVLLRSWGLSTHLCHSLTLTWLGPSFGIPLGYHTTAAAKRRRGILGISSWVLGLEMCWVWPCGGWAGPQTLCTLGCHEKPHQPGAGLGSWSALD